MASQLRAESHHSAPWKQSVGWTELLSHCAGRRQGPTTTSYFLSVLRTEFSVSLWYPSLFLPAVRMAGNTTGGTTNLQAPLEKGQAVVTLDREAANLSPSELQKVGSTMSQCYLWTCFYLALNSLTEGEPTRDNYGMAFLELSELFQF